MYEAGVPKQAISKRTGHLSLTGLCHYERTNVDQQQAIAKDLASSERSTFQGYYFAQSNMAQVPQNQTQNYFFASTSTTKTAQHDEKYGCVSALSDVTNRN